MAVFHSETTKYNIGVTDKYFVLLFQILQSCH